MATCTRLLVVTDCRRRYLGTPYQLRSIAEAWSDGGGGEVLVADDPAALPDADLTFAHVDLTRVPDAFRAAFEARGGVLNAAVADISKRHVSRHLVTRADTWDGPVIVKTDRNHGGWPELDSFRTRGLAARGIARVVGSLPWPVTGMLSADRYPVYDHPRHVPWFVWHHPSLVVERLCTEPRDGLFALRQHMFLGSRQIDSIVFGRGPIVKAATAVRREPLPGAPAAVLALREELGFDYGKFDYTIHDGEVVVFDVNRTPSFGDHDAERADLTARALAPGIGDWLAGVRRPTPRDVRPVTASPA